MASADYVLELIEKAPPSPSSLPSNIKEAIDSYRAAWSNWTGTKDGKSAAEYLASKLMPEDPDIDDPALPVRRMAFDYLAELRRADPTFK